MVVKKFREGDLSVGQVVAEMHCHEANSGELKGWTVNGLFELTHEMFNAIERGFPPIDDGVRINLIIGNKYARVVACEYDYDGHMIKSVLVVYIYDFKRYMTTLTYPG